MSVPRACMLALTLSCAVDAGDAGASSSAQVRTIAEGQQIYWTAKTDGRVDIFRSGGLTLRFSRSKLRFDWYQLTIDDGRGRPFTWTGDAQPEMATALSFAVGRVDPRGVGNQVVIWTYSGGMHCCVITTVLDRTRRGWRAIRLPAAENGAVGSQVRIARFPTDIDGDRIPEFIESDIQFDYQFTSYSGSWLPPRVFAIRDGTLIDRSTSRRLRSIFLKDMAEARAGCLPSEERPAGNGCCAGYVASAARVGRFRDAWQVAIANYDRESAPNFPAHLAKFLHDTGYISARQYLWATANSDPP